MIWDAVLGGVLPRPNPAPEPLPASGFGPLAIFAVALLSIGLLVFWIRRKWHGRAQTPLTRRGEARHQKRWHGPEHPVVRTAALARELLAARLGSRILALTTEEIARDSRVLETLGKQHLEALIELFALADRVKFDRGAGVLSETAEWETTLAACSAVFPELARAEANSWRSWAGLPVTTLESRSRPTETGSQLHRFGRDPSSP